MMFSAILLFGISLLSSASKLETTLTGTYTIGGASPDYATFSSAVSALNSQGVTGSVVFQVRPGTYNEQISISQFSGSSASNTVTFISTSNDSTAVTLTYPSSATAANNYSLKFDGADYVIFQKMTIQRSGTSTFGNVIEFSNSASNNQVKNCRIIGVNTTSTTSNYVLVYSPNTSSDNYNTFSKNTMNNGSYGFWFYGQGSTILETGNIFSGNILSNQSAAGFDIAYQNSVQITGNQFSTNSNYASVNGIRTFYCDNALRITGNKIILQNGGTGIYLYYNDAVPQNGLTANNFVAIAGTNASIGIYVNLSTTQNIFYNSVNITNTNTASKALSLSGLTLQNIDLRNNILNGGSGMAIYVDDNSMTALSISNYNDLFTLGSVLGYWGTSGNKATLADWQSASSKDNNSVSCNPMFFSATDLHSSSGIINGHAIPLSSSTTPVTTDIDGSTRNTTTPDIGADEFSVEDVGVSSVVFPLNACQNTSGKVEIYIRNYGLYSFTGSIPVLYLISGGNVVSGNTGNVTIASGDSILFEFPTTENFSSASAFTMNAYTNLSGDINPNNNQYSNYPFQIFPLPLADAGISQSICLGDSVVLVASGGNTYEWSTMQYTPEVHVTPVLSTMYYVTVTTVNNCFLSDSVFIFVDTIPPPVASFSFVPAGLYVQFTNTSTNVDSSYWDYGDGGWSNELSPIHLFPLSGNYLVTLIVWSNCHSDTVAQTLGLVGIEEINSNGIIEIYPNPVTDMLFISSVKQVEQIVIADISGKQVFNSTYNMPQQGEIKISLQGVKQGLYFVTLSTENITFHKKILVIE